MNTLNQLINALLVLVSAGGVFRITKLLIDILMDPDAKDGNLRRIRNVILFLILCTVITALKTTVMKYYQ
ncbi:MAG: hypothetical protein Q4B70_18320 [Lachnospiraceae bacterium]|nr:hypothetical protein [Lachnospiraceae bacterium]